MSFFGCGKTATEVARLWSMIDRSVKAMNSTQAGASGKSGVEQGSAFTRFRLHRKSPWIVAVEPRARCLEPSKTDPSLSPNPHPGTVGNLGCPNVPTGVGQRLG